LLNQSLERDPLSDWQPVVMTGCRCTVCEMRNKAAKEENGRKVKAKKR